MIFGMKNETAIKFTFVAVIVLAFIVGITTFMNGFPVKTAGFNEPACMHQARGLVPIVNGVPDISNMKGIAMNQDTMGFNSVVCDNMHNILERQGYMVSENRFDNPDILMQIPLEQGQFAGQTFDLVYSDVGFHSLIKFELTGSGEAAIFDMWTWRIGDV